MRTKDRLDELRRLANGASPGVYHDTVQVTCTPPPHHAEIQETLQEAERLRGWTQEVERLTQLVQRLQADPTFHSNPQLQEQLENAATSAHAVGLKVSGALRQLAARVEGGGARRDTAARVARLQLAAARRAWASALGRHEAALDALRDARLHLLRDQIKLTRLAVSEDECEALLESNSLSLFVDNVRAETAEARLALRQAEARRGELARVESALRDVHALFAQLAALVAAQQDQLDTVLHFALQAGDHVGAGGDLLLSGTVSHAKARKKKMGLVICLVVGVAVVLLVLVIT